MSWRDLNVPLEFMAGSGADARFVDDDDSDWSLDDELREANDHVDDDLEGCNRNDDYCFVDDPQCADEVAVEKEIDDIVSRQDIGYLIVLYRRASSRNDMVDIFWSSMGTFPYYCPKDMPLASAKELMKEVKPLPVHETWIYAEFVRELKSIFRSVRNEVQKRKGDLLTFIYRNQPGNDLVWFRSIVYSGIIERLITEGDLAKLVNT